MRFFAAEEMGAAGDVEEQAVRRHRAPPAACSGRTSRRGLRAGGDRPPGRPRRCRSSGCMARASAMPMPRFSPRASACSSRAAMRWVLFSRWLITSGWPGCGPERQDRPSRCRRIRSAARWGNHSDTILWDGAFVSSLFEGVCIGVPFQNEFAGRCGAALADFDREGRAARSTRRAGRRPSRRSAAGAGATTKRVGAAVGSASAEWRSRKTGRPASCGPAMQPPRRRQVEPRGLPRSSRMTVAKLRRCGGLLGDPQRVGGLRRLGETAVRSGARPNSAGQARRIGKPGLPEDLGRADPQDRRRGLALCLRMQAGESTGRSRRPRLHRGSRRHEFRSARLSAARRPGPRQAAWTPVARKDRAPRRRRCAGPAGRRGGTLPDGLAASSSGSVPSIFAILRRRAKTTFPAPRRWSPCRYAFRLIVPVMFL